jgi:hypothetical protein
MPMSTSARPLDTIPDAKRPAWKRPLALVLGTVCFLLLFTGESFGMTVAFFVVGVCFLLSAFLLSRGQTLRRSWSTLVALNFIPLCLGTLVVFLEQKSGAWTQGVSVVVIGLVCSFAGAALAALTARH